KSGEVPLAALDRSERRVLRLKKALGLFDDPYRSLDPEREAVDLKRPEHRALAREAEIGRASCREGGEAAGEAGAVDEKVAERRDSTRTCRGRRMTEPI